MQKIVFYTTILWSFSALAEEAPHLEEEKLAVKTKNQSYEFTVEIPKTGSQKALGLMRRAHMPADHGMLFVWNDEHIRNMWMKDTLLPLDMLFIDKHGVITDIAQQTTPYSHKIITPQHAGMAVLELPGGTCAHDGIAAGDQVIDHYFAR